MGPRHCLFICLVTGPGKMQESVNTYFYCCPRDRIIYELWGHCRRSLAGSLSSSVVLSETNLNKPLPQWGSNPGPWHERYAHYHCPVWLLLWTMGVSVREDGLGMYGQFKTGLKIHIRPINISMYQRII